MMSSPSWTWSGDNSEDGTEVANGNFQRTFGQTKTPKNFLLIELAKNFHWTENSDELSVKGGPQKGQWKFQMNFRSTEYSQEFSACQFTDLQQCNAENPHPSQNRGPRRLPQPPHSLQQPPPILLCCGSAN